MCDLCRQAMSPSIAGRRPLVGDPLKIFVECDVALDTSLVSRDGSFEEIGELLDILELHETERVLGAELLGEAELHEALIGAELEVGAGVGHAHAGDAFAEDVFGEVGFAFDGFLHHFANTSFEVVVEEVAVEG